MLERAWADAITRRDEAVINRIMADDFEGIDPVGNVFTKATYLPDLETVSSLRADRARSDQDPRLRRDRLSSPAGSRSETSPGYGRIDERLRQAAGPLAMRRLSRMRRLPERTARPSAKAGGREGAERLAEGQKRPGRRFRPRPRTRCVACHVTNVPAQTPHSRSQSAGTMRFSRIKSRSSARPSRAGSRRSMSHSGQR